MRPGIVVPMRPNSKRLPMKHLVPIGPNGESVVQVLIHRARKTKLPVTIALPAHCAAYELSCVGAKVWNGTPIELENSVFWRCAQAAARDGYDPVVVWWGDSPLEDPERVRAMVDDYEAEGYEMLWRWGAKGMRSFVVRQKTLELTHVPDDALRLSATVMTKLWGLPKVGEYAVDTRADVRRLRRLLVRGGIDATEEQLEEASKDLGDRTDMRAGFARQHPDLPEIPG